MPIDIVSTLPVHPSKTAKIRDITPFSGNVSIIVVHTTNTETSIQNIAEYDVEPGNHISLTGCPTYTYHDTIKTNGKIYHCVPYEKETWHAGKYNFRSIAVAMNYISISKDHEVHYAPGPNMFKSLWSHLGWLCLNRGISPREIYGHRELKGTGWFWQKGSKVLRKTCPGIMVDLDNMRTMATKYLQLNLKANGFYTEGRLDGVYGPMTWGALRDYHSSSLISNP